MLVFGFVCEVLGLLGFFFFFLLVLLIVVGWGFVCFLFGSGFPFWFLGVGFGGFLLLRYY